MFSLRYIILFFSMSGLSQCIKKRDTVSRIFNGQDAKRDQFPWHVLLVVTFPNVQSTNDPTRDLTQFGGGVWISKKHILTCSHTFYPK